MVSRNDNGSKAKHKPKKSFAGEGDVLASLNSLLEESGHERGYSSSHVTTTDDSEASSTSDLFFASAKRFQSSSFNSLSLSDDDDSTQTNPKRVIFSPSTARSPRDVLVHPHTKYTKLDLLPENDNDAQMSSKVKPVMESPPPVQMMERPPPRFDPNRIPESIFTSKSSGPTDWSVASNESLFSIQIGNSSFSKDHTVSVPKQVLQSGEAEVSEEVGKTTEGIIDSGNPPAEVAESDSLEEYYEVESRISQPEDDITIIGFIPRETQNDQRKAKPATPEPSSYVNRVNEKPEITPKTKKSSEYCCSGCSCEFCCSVKLKCCFCKWPNCCNCCEPPSDCNNCCGWPHCKSTGCSSNCCSSFKCCKWPTCANCCCSFKSCCSLKCCKWPSCSSCKWPSCSNCVGCSNCCNWSCKNCCKWPSCSCTNCCKCPSFNCFSSCSWPKGCCKWPSCSGCSCKWRCIFCCLPKTNRRNSSRSRCTCGWFSSIFCC